MRKFSSVISASLLALVLMPLAAHGQTDSAGASAATEQTPASAAADNSEKNAMHDGEEGVSADQQGNSKADVETTRKIRRAITKDKSLSTYGHNVKIITKDGSVILKGPVKNDQEKTTIEKAAAQVAGQSKVKSELEVK